MSPVCFYYDPLTEFDRLFGDALAARFRPSTSATSPSTQHVQVDLFRPRMDIHEGKEATVVIATCELPDTKSNDITIDVHQNCLAVAGETRKFHSHEKGGYTVHERSCGKFSRTSRLPFATKAEDVKAKIENGVLTITFPKATSATHCHSVNRHPSFLPVTGLGILPYKVSGVRREYNDENLWEPLTRTKIARTRKYVL
ncbi:HSP20-like chaperone [Lanmaoa asiatica]|nr:HSP20-like chaperone [Lanmaoa asiatica]